MAATSLLYPLRFQPLLKRLLWGGRRLGTMLGKPIGPGADYAESWEIADHGEYVSVVADGALSGRTLRELLAENAVGLLGPGFADRRQFPLLVKLLDARQTLSVQVHPNDECARRMANDNGKTEAWLVLHADPGSRIYAGLERGVDAGEFRAALSSGDVEPLLHAFEPAAGDCVLIPAGTVHAIGAGIVLAEVQQMSNTTYRVYDWGRVGADGVPRVLHIAEAMECIDFAAGPVDRLAPARTEESWGVRERLAMCDYFEMERLTIHAPVTVGSRERFTILMGLAGESVIEYGSGQYALRTGQTILLPAAVGALPIRSAGPPATILTCTVPSAGSGDNHA